MKKCDGMNISILTDNPESWIIKFIPLLIEKLSIKHTVSHYYSKDELKGGDILCALSCEKILTEEYLNLFTSTIVAHPSPLPLGKGWSPLAWQILEGKNTIPVTLIEADKQVDSGLIYYQEFMTFSGTELNDEIKSEQFRVTTDLVVKYCNNFPVKGMKQQGNESYYRKFNAEDNRLDINKTINEQFNILRISDNERYPCWFEIEGTRFNLKIEKEEVYKKGKSI